MQFREFVGQVQTRTRLGSMGEAISAIRATLQTLGERLAGGAADNLASQLPREIGEYLKQGSLGDLHAGEQLSLAEFYGRVAMKEQANPAEAAHHAQAVIEVMKEVVSPGEIENVRAQLPEGYAPLFESPDGGQSSRGRSSGTQDGASPR